MAIFVALLAICACSALWHFSNRPPTGTSPLRWQPPTNIAHEILEIEGRALPTSPAMREVLGATLSDAADRMKQLAPTLTGLDERERALATLRMIAAVLREHLFVYPGRGAVPTLHDGLAPVNVDRRGLELLLSAAENAQAALLIQGHPQGNFRVVDCDIFAMLYVSVGEALGLPIAMVELPPLPDGTSHAYVRWTLADGKTVDWEVVSGWERDAATHDAMYFAHAPMTPEQARKQRAFAVPMTRQEMLAYAHLLLGAVWQAQGSDELALAAFQTAMDQRPTSPSAYNEVAWLLATSSDAGVRNPAKAVAVGEKLVGLWPSASHLDTLAAAYAADGQYERAVQTEVTALETASRLDSKLAGYRVRCAAYLRREPYIQPRREELQKELQWEALADPIWRDLALPTAQQQGSAEGSRLPPECTQMRAKA